MDASRVGKAANSNSRKKVGGHRRGHRKGSRSRSIRIDRMRSKSKTTNPWNYAGRKVEVDAGRSTREDWDSAGHVGYSCGEAIRRSLPQPRLPLVGDPCPRTASKPRCGSGLIGYPHQPDLVKPEAGQYWCLLPVSHPLRPIPSPSGTHVWSGLRSIRDNDRKVGGVHGGRRRSNSPY